MCACSAVLPVVAFDAGELLQELVFLSQHDGRQMTATLCTVALRVGPRASLTDHFIFVTLSGEDFYKYNIEMFTNYANPHYAILHLKHRISMQSSTLPVEETLINLTTKQNNAQCTISRNTAGI